MKQQVSQWVKMTNYAFKLHVEQQPFPKTLMAFDVGLKSTGVAITSSDMRHAFVRKITIVVFDNAQGRAEVEKHHGKSDQTYHEGKTCRTGDWKTQLCDSGKT